MRVSEFNGTGDFLLGGRLAGLRPAFAVATEELAPTITTNFKIDVRTSLPDDCRSIPRTDIACVRPPDKDAKRWADIILGLNPRVMVAEGRHVKDFFKVLDMDRFDAYSGEYTGVEMGLPHEGTKVFHVLVRKKTTAKTASFHMPESDNKARKIGDVLDAHDMPELYVDKASAMSNLLDDQGLAKSVPLRYDKNYTILVRGGRKLSPRELSRLAGFTDDFVLPEGNALAYRLVGMSTWPKGIFRILKEVKEWLL